jgi:septum site-determining protein MinD
VGTVSVITSGKGGTGKTSLTGGLANALALEGQRVLCIDCDIGLRNLDLSLGMADTALMDFSDVITQRCSLSQAATAHPTIPGLFLLTAPLTPPQDDEPSWEDGFRALIAQAGETYDHILIDSPAGLGLGFRLAVQNAQRAILVATSDPASLRDAQRVVSQLAGLADVRLVVNRVRPRLLRRLGATIDDAMDTVGLPLLGLVPEDPQVVLAAASGRPLLQVTRRGAAQSCVNIAKRLNGQDIPLMKLRLW